LFLVFIFKSRDFDSESDFEITQANRYYSIELGGAFFLAFICNLFVTSVSAKSFYSTAQASNLTLENAVSYI
jgi:hypothetical protein